jgi:hypothetical protein
MGITLTMDRMAWPATAVVLRTLPHQCDRNLTVTSGKRSWPTIILSSSDSLIPSSPGFKRQTGKRRKQSTQLQTFSARYKNIFS